MAQIVPISLTRLVSLISLLLYLSAGLAASGVRDALWVTNGPVYTSLAAGSYTGGPVGGGVNIDTLTVLLDTQYPFVSGRINTVIPDGAGGWYIGGLFAMVGGIARDNIAHINPDKRVDTNWSPDANGEVRSLTLSGDGAALYVGGDFTTISTLGRNRLAEVSVATGNANPNWDPDVNDVVRVLVLSGDGARLYVGGDFTSIGGNSRSRLAALQISSGNVISSWNPAPDGSVLDMTLSGDGNILYVGGEFLNVGGLSRNRIAVIDSVSGVVDASWNPNADAAVRALGFSSSDALLYIGGDFTSIGGEVRNRIASINTSAINPDRATTWNPDADGPVNAFVLSGDILFLGGDFSAIGSQAHSRLAAVKTTVDNNNAQPWNPGVDNTVNSMALAGTSLYVGGNFSVATDGSTIYLGGDFTYVGPSTGGGIAINADPTNPANDQPDFAYPDVHGTVYAVVPDTVGGWYIGGQFSRVGDITLSNIAHINSDLTVDAAWDPDASGAVRALQLSGTTLYVGGDFTGFNGGAIVRNNIAALDTATNVAANIPTAWDPDASGAVRALQLSGTTLYVGGDFTGFNGGAIVRNNIAALDIATNVTANIPTAWDPDANGTVRALQLSGTTLYVGGDFTGFNGGAIVRNNIAALDIATNVTANIPTAWDPDANGAVRALQLSGTTLYVGGDFTGFNGGAIVRNNIVALDTVTNVTANIPTAWDPDANGAVRTLQLSGTTLYAGGDFNTVSGGSRSRLVALTADPAAATNDSPTAWNPVAGGPVYAFSLSGTRLFTGGEFVSVGGGMRSRLAALSLNDGRATGWNPGADGIVRSMVFSSNATTLYMGGDFSVISGQVRSRAAELDIFTGLPTFWSPAADAAVTTLLLAEDGASIYAGGLFSVIGGQSRNWLAEIRTNGTATTWMPELSGSSAAAPGVYALVQDDTTLYVGGDFSIVGGANHMGVVALDITTASATNWAPQVAGVVRTMNLLVDDSVLYIGGGFTAVGGDTRLSIASLSTLNNLATTWNPQADGDVLSMASSLDKVSLYVGGNFTVIGGKAQSRLAALATTDGLANNSWNHQADRVVRSIVQSDDGSVIYAGGDFELVDSLSRARIAALDALPLETDAPFTTATPPGGAYNGITNKPVVLACDDGAGSGCADTYYTSDGSTPTTDSTLYTEPISLIGDATLKFFSVDKRGNTETVNTENYLLELLAPVTTATPASRVFSSRNLEVALSCVDNASGCAQTFYSKDDNTPVALFNLYSGPVSVGDNTTLRFFSTDLAGNVEVVQRENYVSNNGGVFSVWFITAAVLLLKWRNATTRKFKS